MSEDALPYDPDDFYPRMLTTLHMIRNFMDDVAEDLDTLEEEIKESYERMKEDPIMENVRLFDDARVQAAAWGLTFAILYERG